MSAEDPYEEPFTSTAVFHGGTYVTLPGASNASTEIAQLLLRAVLHGPPGATPQFADEVARLGLAVLKLSDAMCARAGLGRYEAPVPGKGDDAVVPNAALFRPLQSAVTFSSVELDELLGADWRNTIASLVSPVGTTLPTDNPDDSGFLARSPILEVGNSWIVIAPGLLLTALRHRILMLAGVFGELTTVATHFHQIVLIEVDKALDRMGYRRHVARGDAPATELGTDILVSFDYDKILHCIVVTDPITEYDDNSVLGEWTDPDFSERLGNHLASMRDHLFGIHESITGVLQLVVVDGVGRAFVAGIPAVDEVERSPLLSTNLNDLRVIAHKCADDPLALWKFTSAREELLKTCKILAFSALDVFQAYTSHENSFYFGDDGRPNMINFAPDAGLDLRMADARGRDVHGVVDWTGSRIVTVERFYDGTDAPVYALDPSRGELAFLYEDADLPVWVHAQPTDVTDRKHLFDMADTVVYWIWQIGEVLEWQPTTALPTGSVLIEVSVDPERGNPSHSGSWFNIDVDDNRLRIWLSPEGFGSTSTSDNTNERELVAGLVWALSEAITHQPAIDLDILVNLIAPLGPKKKMVAMHPKEAVLWPGTLPGPRYVQLADLSVRLDATGEWLSGRYAKGTIDSSERVELLNSLVSHEFEVMQQLVSELNANQLVDFLIAQNESLIRAEAVRNLTLPTKLACFGQETKLHEELLRDTASEVTRISHSISNRVRRRSSTRRSRPPDDGSLRCTLGVCF